MNRQIFVNKLKDALPMSDEHICKVISDSINSTGNDGIHLIIAMEELSELQKEISNREYEAAHFLIAGKWKD